MQFLFFFVILSITLTIIFYESLIDFFSCILTLIGIYSYWCKSTKAIRIGNLVVSLCYMIYAIAFNSWFVVICELYLVINNLVGIYKYEKMK